MATYEINIGLIGEGESFPVEQLRIGDIVYISGKAFTCRSRLHRWIFDEGHPLPAAAAERQLLIHVGPIVLREGTPNVDETFKLVSFMPTSSIRFEKWGARSVENWNLKMIIGKTTMGEETMEKMAELGCVHVSPQSVSPNLWLEHISIENVELFDELGTIEATWLLTLDKLGPFVVDIDTQGNNLFDLLDPVIEKNREEAYKMLGIPEDFTYTKLYGR